MSKTVLTIDDSRTMREMLNHALVQAGYTVIQAVDGVEGLEVLQANGAAGGQTVGHFHMHVVPRHEDDGISFTWPRKEPGPQVLADYAARLREALA